MDGIRHQVEASLSRTREVIMEDRYRRLQFDPAVVGPHYWAQPAPHSNGRFKRHLPAVPKKKSKDTSKKSDHFDIPAYSKHYRDKYGSVSAHSTSAIYGALRAPHCHEMYGPSNMWYASVRSLNSRPRDAVYPAEAYEWREPIYEDVTREMCAIAPQVELVPRPACVCMVRRRLPHDGSSSSHPKSSRHQPRCKYCMSVFPNKNGLMNGASSSSKRTLVSSDKMKASSPVEEKTDPKSESTGRMSSYKKCITGSSKYSNNSVYTKGTPTKDSSKISRKSILECDVTAYDLIKKVAKTPSVSEIEDSDVDDDLSDNAVAKINKSRLLKLQNKSKLLNSSPCESHIASKKSPSKFRKFQSENCIYSESPSVLVGGQRIFTDNHRSKSPELSSIPDSQEDNVSASRDSCSSRWRKMSVSDESICIPDPDYDFSDGSDDGTVIDSKYRDPKFTYSPPSLRKSYTEPYNGLGNSSREISKSMSSLLSEDTLIPSINVNNSYKSSPILKIKSATEQDCDNYRDQQSPLEYPESTEAADDSSYANDLQASAASVNDDLNLKQDSRYESSSDCSSSGGTLSSDYPTWTSSSSNELKSILKKKRRRENAIQELEDATRVFRNAELKEAQKKKQVQFTPGFDNTKLVDNNPNCASKDVFQVSEGNDSGFVGSVYEPDARCQDAKSPAVIMCDTYNAMPEATSDKTFIKNIAEPQDLQDDFSPSKGGAYVSVNDPFSPDVCEEKLTISPSFKEFLREQNTAYQASRTSGKLDGTKDSIPSEKKVLALPELPQRRDLHTSLSPKLPPCRSSSLEDVREGVPKKGILEVKDKRRRRRTTLPKRRFSDLHLHILLCPTRSSLCGDGSSSDDVPLTAAAQRAHRSLPESPIELDQVSTFNFDFGEKTSNDKMSPSSRSVFYVSVDGHGQRELPKVTENNGDSKNPLNGLAEDKRELSVSPSVDDSCNHSTTPYEQLDLGDCDLEENISPEQYDTDEDNLQNEYENLDPIYEELSDISNSSKRLTSLESNQKSFFEGASKIDILSYLEDAKERGISEGLSEDEKVILEEDDEDEKVLSGEDDDIVEKSRVIANNNLNHKEVLLTVEEDPVKTEHIVPEIVVAETSKSTRISEVERNDSGVGAETSKPPRLKLLPTDCEEQLCADCDHQVEPVEDEDSGLLFSPLVCHKCDLRRSERKEIIIEFVDTELKYGRDLRIIKEEFYRPMEIAGLLAKEQLLSIFVNLDELIAVNTKFSEKLQDALDIAMEHGDEDYTTSNIGKIFLETSSMLHAFETYCVKQASASVLLNNLEKEKELLRIFLRVSQMENTLLRRMNLPAFLMVPVQRVTRYPLLLSRLHKVTPIHHKDRNALKESQQKVELHLEHINQQTKGVGGTKIWRRISNISASHRRLGNLQDIGSIKLRKMALEVLQWKQDEVRFVMAGKLLFTQITDYPWNKKGKTVKFTPLHALLIALGKPNSNYRPEMSSVDNAVLFPRNTGIRDASLVLMKEKNGRFIAIRDPLYLGNCVISCDSETEDVFEIQEYTTKDAYLLKGENKKETKEWLRQLRYHAKDLGSWRKRRNALANIMINGMIRQ